MVRKYLPLVLLAAVTLMVSIGYADEVSVGNSSNGQVNFTNTGGTTSMSLTSSCGGHSQCVSGLGLFTSDLGNYQIWVSGGPETLAVPDPPGDFPIVTNGATVNFSFTLAGGLGQLTGTLDLEDIVGGTTSAPQMIGTFTTSTVSGAFTSSFVVGATSDADFTINLFNAPTVSDVYNGLEPMTQGEISSGEILPQVPEPSTLGLLGSGLLAAAGVLKRRLM